MISRVLFTDPTLIKNPEFTQTFSDMLCVINTCIESCSAVFGSELNEEFIKMHSLVNQKIISLVCMNSQQYSSLCGNKIAPKSPNIFTKYKLHEFTLYSQSLVVDMIPIRDLHTMNNQQFSVIHPVFTIYGNRLEGSILISEDIVHFNNKEGALLSCVCILASLIALSNIINNMRNDNSDILNVTFNRNSFIQSLYPLYKKTLEHVVHHYNNQNKKIRVAL